MRILGQNLLYHKREWFCFLRLLEHCVKTFFEDNFNVSENGAGKMETGLLAYWFTNWCTASLTHWLTHPQKRTRVGNYIPRQRLLIGTHEAHLPTEYGDAVYSSHILLIPAKRRVPNLTHCALSCGSSSHRNNEIDRCGTNCYH